MANNVRSIIDAAAEFIVTTTIALPSVETRRASVIVVLDGDDKDACAIYDALHKLGITEGLPNPPLPSGAVTPLVCPYRRLKEAMAKVGMDLGERFDADPPEWTVRVLGATNGEVGIETVTVRRPAGNA